MKKQLLIVDDDLSLRHTIATYLESAGFDVISASSVKSALQKIQSRLPDLVITDIMMPHIDGYDFVEKLRMDNRLLNIPIIVLTAKGMTEDRIKGYDLGCNAYLIKPFDPNELLSIINNIFKNIYLLQLFSNNSQIASISSENLLKVDQFTHREWTILTLVAKGYTNKEIANCLQVSIRNVEKYVSRLLNKTNTRNRTELAKVAISTGI